MDYWYVDWSEMGVLEPLDVAESIYKPIVDVRPSQCRLRGLQQEDKVR